MKKPLIITIGAVLILIALGIWGYLLVYGTPENSGEIFADLGFDSNVQNAAVETPAIATENAALPLVDTVGESLRQITTRPIAGFQFVASSTDLIRYVERGTGHVYEINIVSGAERRVSGTTIAQVIDAVFSSDGASVALITADGYKRNILAGVILEDDASIDFINLPDGAFDPFFASTYVLQYAVPETNGSAGYRIDIRDNTPTRIFSIPLTAVSVLWDSTPLVYTKPAAGQLGSLYSTSPRLSPVAPNGFGFVAGSNTSYYFTSKNVGSARESYAIAKSDGEPVRLAIEYIPEKCTSVASQPHTLWCGAPLETYDADFIEGWYKGELQSPDMLWKMDVLLGEAELSENPIDTTGRVVDIDMISAHASGNTLLLRNKIDNTLWLYDTSAE